MSKFKVAILGAGHIGGMMARTVAGMVDAEIYAVASRSIDRAQEFAKEFGIGKAYGSYQELAADPKIDLVYIATPHSEHCANTLLCLNNGKNVLCEKAFAINEKEAKEMIDLAREKKLLLAEALWVRYMPMTKTLQSVINSGSIGDPMTLTCNLGYLISHVKRLTDLNLAGGALLDLGVYTLAFASIAFGDDIEKIDSSVIKSESGVDAQNSITLTYKDGKMAVLNSTYRALSDRQGVIYGTKGFIVVENINNFEVIKVYNENRQLIENYDQPEQITGYEYQVEACMEAIKAGVVECPQMTHKQTLKIMNIMDTLRKQWGIKYPME